MKKNLFLLAFVLVALVTGCKKDPFDTDDSGKFTDTRNNRQYNWVRIGEQIWMGQNLAYLPFVNPSTVSSVAEAKSYLYGYEGTDVAEAMTKPNIDNYGGLYNFEAAKIACPDGWHLPTDAEWKTMEMYLGMSQTDADKTGMRDGGSVGLKLKTTLAWGTNVNTNSSKFSAVPAGYLSATGWNELMEAAVFWTASGAEAGTAFDRYLNSTGGVDRGAWPRSDGYSVRCVRD